MILYQFSFDHSQGKMDVSFLEFLTEEVDDITSLQISENIETWHHVFEGLQNPIQNFCEDSIAGAADSCTMDLDCGGIMALMECDVQKSKWIENNASRLGSVVSDDKSKKSY